MSVLVFYSRYLSQVHKNVHVFLMMSSTSDGTHVTNVSMLFELFTQALYLTLFFRSHS